MPRRLTAHLLILWSLLSPSGLAWGAAAQGAALQESGHSLVWQQQAGQGSYEEKLALVNIQAGGEVALGSEYEALVPALNSDNEVQEFGKILSGMGSLGTAAVTRLASNYAKIGKVPSGGGSGVSTNTTSKTAVRTDGAKGMTENADDLASIRTRYGLTDANTVATGKTDIPGLGGQTFEGLSPALRRQAGLDSLDDLYGVNRPIKSPNPNPIASRHAEEDIFNGLARQIDDAGLNASQLNGRTVNIHTSNAGGVCNTCYQGIGNSNATAGVIKQFSERYPTLNIRITAEGGTVRQGVDTIVVRGGQIVD